MLRYFLEKIFQKRYEEIIEPNTISSMIFYAFLAYLLSIIFTSLLTPLIGPYTDIKASV